MHVTRVRFWILAALLFIYLAGILILSAVTLHEPRNASISAIPKVGCEIHLITVYM